MRHSNTTPSVNSGSMADIAFLLLIFFLVTTTIASDEGINRKMPQDCPPNIDCKKTLNERNVFRIQLNAENEIFVEDEIVTIDTLKDLTKAFIDNNGDKSCSYCNGIQLITSSDHPKEAVISIQNDRKTSYDLYISVQDEVTKAYYELRAVYSRSVFNKYEDDLSIVELKQVRDAYPFVISEAETK